MKLPIFQLEDYLAKWEFKAPYLLCSSDAESMEMKELIQSADGESLHLWNNLRLSYTETAGLPLLRTEISHLYPSLSADHIYCLAGAEEGIFCAMNVLIQPNDHVIVITPCYQSLEDLPKSLQAHVTAIPLDPFDWSLDLDRVKQALRPSTRLIAINFPHNPTGALLDAPKLNGLVTLARSQGAYLFSDEVYRYLESDESKRPPAIADLYEKGISLGVMSKAFGLAGLRIGWLANRLACKPG
ncbi:aminotransferase, classes I and II [Candidatus Protochlamydia naegleriophila]|uniref:Aminotransferase, classes I and II n=1 Tax=Candidatus Protochlamydia naegleriophila TaxID=389348 RepID=A0A0U5EUU9_9BACT|nr:aminotransferase class I/II-fold pyridoxal phosphate-dependent enzyme [Candidatus Protochlamydia naegleriophila]CUI17937.1 aminotransferase, classes I and II [Candidatus Protochlamydia naegleriophila]